MQKEAVKAQTLTASFSLLVDKICRYNKIKEIIVCQSEVTYYANER